jgi:hypothetical protein
MKINIESALQYIKKRNISKDRIKDREEVINNTKV